MTAENQNAPRCVLVAEDEGLIRLDIVETLDRTEEKKYTS